MNALSPVAAPPRMSHNIPTALGTLHVVEIGSGAQPVVLWPSIFTDHHIYDDLTLLLGTTYRFLLIDGPAHGGSEGPTYEFSMADCADAMKQVMDHFGLETAVIGGTSWGGLTAAELALAAPDRATALILMNTPMQIDARRPGLPARMIAWGARWMLRRAVFRNGVAKSFFSEDTLRRNPGCAAQFHQMLIAAPARPMAAAIRSVILRGTPLISRAPRLTVPTLVIAGREDTMYPIHVQAKAALLAPLGQFEAVPGKHISAVDAPDDVAETIHGFIEAVTKTEAKQ